jgi:GAF domain-containing protein
MLRRDGYAFPLQVRGELLGLLIIGSRPEEHYSSEERELFALVAHDVGAALFAIRAQIGDEQLAEARRRETILQEALETARVREIALLDMLRVGFQKPTG